MGGATLFVLGGLIYGLLLADFFAHMASDEPIWWAVALGQLLSAAFLAVILGWKGVAGAKEGFQAGALIGVLLALAMGLMFYGTMNIGYTMSTVIVDSVVSVFVYGACGAVIAIFLNRGGAEA